VADPRKVNKWVKFVGTNIHRWKDILDDIRVDQIPLQYVVEVRYHHTGGEVNIKSVSPGDRSITEDVIDFSRNHDDLTSIEFIVDIDKINADISLIVKSLLAYTQDPC
jgi:hypothetical protein